MEGQNSGRGIAAIFIAAILSKGIEYLGEGREIIEISHHLSVVPYP